LVCKFLIIKKLFIYYRQLLAKDYENPENVKLIRTVDVGNKHPLDPSWDITEKKSKEKKQVEVQNVLGFDPLLAFDINSKFSSSKSVEEDDDIGAIV
jgi:hypothetical protein